MRRAEGAPGHIAAARRSLENDLRLGVSELRARFTRKHVSSGNLKPLAF